MDRRPELIEALLDLSRSADRVAKLLSQKTVGDFTDEAIIEVSGSSQETINPALYPHWPAAHHHSPPIKLARDLTVLEWSMSPNQPACVGLTQAKRVDLITTSLKWNLPSNVKIITEQECCDQYDVGIIWESIEFTKNPLLILHMLKKHCRKIAIRFRPWSSRNGAFLDSQAFIHLATDVNHEVQFKAIRPQAVYEKLLGTAGLTIEERRINSTHPEAFFANTDILRVIRDRTWGQITTQQAIQIMATDSVDYVVSCQ